MPTVVQLQLPTCMVWFEWNDAKAKTNERKHGVRFDDAMLVFSDPYAFGRDHEE